MKLDWLSESRCTEDLYIVTNLFTSDYVCSFRDNWQVHTGSRFVVVAYYAAKATRDRR